MYRFQNSVIANNGDLKSSCLPWVTLYENTKDQGINEYCVRPNRTIIKVLVFDSWHKKEMQRSEDAIHKIIAKERSAAAVSNYD